MRDLSKNFYEKMNSKFGEILFENDQIFFIRDIASGKLVEPMDYSRVFFNCTFDIFKKEKEDRSISLVESDKFEVVNRDGSVVISYTVQKNGELVPLTKEQFEKVVVDSCGNVFKIDGPTNRAVPADVNIGLGIKVI